MKLEISNDPELRLAIETVSVVPSVYVDRTL